MKCEVLTPRRSTVDVNAFARMCLVPTALRVNGPPNCLSVDVRPPLLSPSQVSLGPQAHAYRTADLGDSPGKSFFFFFFFVLGNM